VIIEERVRDDSWRYEIWPSELSWVPDLMRASDEQVAFLRRVREGLRHGWFREPAPLRYRSLQLTQDDKRLEEYRQSTALFGPGRLTPKLLGFYVPVLPLAWERVGPGGRVLAFENKEPFYVSRELLSRMPRPPYDIVVYGHGNQFPASVVHLTTISSPVTFLGYVGDLDGAGLAIAIRAREQAIAAGLPTLRAAPGFHAAMLSAAASFGCPDGWPPRRASMAFDPAATHLPNDVQERAFRIVRAGRRISEEVLGPTEMEWLLDRTVT
jgi:hypothetical protein